MKCYYLKNAEVHCEYRYWPPTKQAKFINLALLERGQLSYNDDFSSYMIQRSADDVFAKKTKIRYDELFQSPESGARILIEGRPGCGKTILLRKISRDWAEEKILTNISLLLLVPLRCFHRKENIESKDILKLYNAGPEVESEIATGTGRGICILLDGIDEYPYSSSQEGFILALMQCRLLPESIVIVSSRPASSDFLRCLATDRVEVLGFLRPQIYQYIEECYRSEQQKAKALLTYLENHPNIRHMCYLPLHLAMIVYLKEYLQNKHQSMPRTETDVYLKFTTCSLLRDMQRDQEHNIPLNLISPESLPDERLSAFRKICQLAYFGIVESEQIFSGEDIKKLFGDQGIQFKPLGILTTDTQFSESGIEKNFSFVHLTFQEFLAAYHLTKCSDTEQIESIEHYGRNKNMTVVWKFYCGLTQLKTGVSAQIFKLMTEVADFAMLDLLHCVHESFNSSYCRELMAFTNGVVKIEDETLTPSDSVAIAYSLENAVDMVGEIKLYSCRWDEEEISVLSSHITTNITTVKTLW